MTALVPVKFYNLARMSTTTTGTGTITLGSAVSSYLSFSGAGIQNGDVVWYGIADGSNSEAGYGTYTSSGTTLTRNPLVSTNSNSAINLSGSAQVFLIAAREGVMSRDDDYGTKNLFRNPRMDIAQRGPGGFTVTSSFAYTLDGWMVACAGVNGTVSQQWNDQIRGNSLKLVGAASQTSATIKQRIESYDAARLLGPNKNAMAITVQFTIVNKSGASITPQIATGYASAQDNFGTVTSDLAATNLQSIPNGSVGIVAYTFVPSVNIVNGYEIQLLFGSALAGTGDYVEVTDADIRLTPILPTGLCSFPPPAEGRSIAQELINCQRHYRTTYIGAAPGANAANGYRLVPVPSNTITNQQYVYAEIFTTNMRGTPSITVYGYSGTSGELSNASGGSLASGSGTVGTSFANGFVIYNNNGSSVTTTSGVVLFHYVASAEL